MKTKDVSIFKQKILEMLPVKQVDMWKKLEIDSREASYIVDIMLKENLVTRKRQDGSFLIEKSNGKGDIEYLKKKVDTEKKKVDTEKKKVDTEKKKVDTEKKKVDTEKKKVDTEKKKVDTEKKKVDTEKKKVDTEKKKVDTEKKKVDTEKKKVDVEKKKVDTEKKKVDTEKKKVDVEKKKVDVEKKKVDVEKKEVDAELKKEMDFVATVNDENIQNVKTEDINALKQKVLDVLPILQGNLWKRLDACDCNYLQLVDLMVKEGLITRTKQGKLFLLEAANKGKHKHGAKTDVPTIIPDENIQKKKPKDTNDLRKAILGMLPIAPSDILEKLDISNRVCSSTINTMIQENLMVRTEKNGHFLLEKVGKSGKKNNIDYTATLSSKKRFAPCCGCTLECDAATCILLTEWLLE